MDYQCLGQNRATTCFEESKGLLDLAFPFNVLPVLLHIPVTYLMQIRDAGLSVVCTTQ